MELVGPPWVGERLGSVVLLQIRINTHHLPIYMYMYMNVHRGLWNRPLEFNFCCDSSVWSLCISCFRLFIWALDPPDMQQQMYLLNKSFSYFHKYNSTITMIIMTTITNGMITITAIIPGPREVSVGTLSSSQINPSVLLQATCVILKYYIDVMNCRINSPDCLHTKANSEFSQNCCSTSQNPS